MRPTSDTNHPLDLISDHHAKRDAPATISFLKLIDVSAPEDTCPNLVAILIL
jgi:hypothetical protein